MYVSQSTAAPGCSESSCILYPSLQPLAAYQIWRFTPSIKHQSPLFGPPALPLHARLLLVSSTTVHPLRPVFAPLPIDSDIRTFPAFAFLWLGPEHDWARRPLRKGSTEALKNGVPDINRFILSLRSKLTFGWISVEKAWLELKACRTETAMFMAKIGGRCQERGW